MSFLHLHTVEMLSQYEIFFHIRKNIAIRQKYYFTSKQTHLPKINEDLLDTCLCNSTTEQRDLGAYKGVISCDCKPCKESFKIDP